MRERPTPAEVHGLHEDERARVRILARQEERVRVREHLRLIAPLVQEPHEFQTPIPHRYEPSVVVERMDRPGERGEEFGGVIY